MHLDQHHYSLMRGGLVHRLLQAAGMLRGTARLSLWMAAALVVISLAPLVVLTARAGTLWTLPPGMPLLGTTPPSPACCWRCLCW